MEKILSILRYLRKHPVLIDCLLVALLTVPAFLSILNTGYFSMHDDQHIVRLHLFDQALREGNLYPRWVDGLGFGYGYPLFNFYPPLIYIIAEIFHLVGFSLIWSIKMVVIVGFVSAAIGMYLLVTSVYKRQAGIVASVLYTYFFYHGVTAYVRGAFAEFFTLSILPFVFLGLINLYKKSTLRNAIFSAIPFALLILCHPLIAFPSVLFIGIFFVFLYVNTEKNERPQFTFLFTVAIAVGLGLSAFFWLPSMAERQFTYVDDILTTELADYSIHFVAPQQFIQSNWGYGGSGPGLDDGITFQLGKVHMFLAAVSIFVIGLLFSMQPKKREKELFGMLFAGLLLFSLFMTVDISKFIWDTVGFLSYLQFPWRFLTFAAVFISVLGGILFSYIFQMTDKLDNSFLSKLASVMMIVTIFATILLYSRYFKPQEYRNVTDADLTTKAEIQWRISRTSFEFVPKGVETIKSELGTTILAITPSDIPQESYSMVKGKALIEEEVLTSSYKSYIVRVGQPVTFQLNTFNFPGWEAVIQEPGSKQARILPIRDDNPLKLINVDLPPGEYILSFQFTDTPVRFAGNIITFATILLVLLARWKEKEVKQLISRQFKQV
jgi:hypothetical protein